MSLFFIQLIFMSLGILIATIFVQMKSGIAVSIATLLACEIIYDIFKPIMGGYSVRYLVPIKYFSTDYMIQHAAYEIPFVIITLILITINVFLSYIYVLWKKRYPCCMIKRISFRRSYR
jgi:ABC-2 type transport system permease protein